MRAQTNRQNKVGWRRSGPSWLIVRRERGGVQALTLDPAGEAGGRESLAVFSFQNSAEAFLKARRLGGEGWRVRQSGTGEILSLLSGLYRGVRRVALDPLPEIGSRTLSGLFTVGRRVFMESLLGRGPRWFYREVYGRTSPLRGT